ncbi:MAG: hypothetical protein L6R41_001617 [Letrouitia leprolyta]|nr:MAG: hypothetical protein L6R41_001617 [Letrouitia leprolyta]
MQPQYPNVNATDPHDANDTFFYHIPDTNLNLYVRDVGSRLPFDDISSCLQSLGIYIIRQIAIRGNEPAIARAFRHGTVFLDFNPAGITWMDAGEVTDALEKIIANDSWTWATHVTIGSTGSTGRPQMVGYLNWGYRSPEPGAAGVGDGLQST